MSVCVHSGDGAPEEESVPVPAGCWSSGSEHLPAGTRLREPPDVSTDRPRLSGRLGLARVGSSLSFDVCKELRFRAAALLQV